MALVDVETRTGFKCQVDDRLRNDWRFIKLGKVAASSSTVETITAAEGLLDLLLAGNTQPLLDHVMELNDGFIPVEPLINELTDIISALNGPAAKNFIAS